MYKQLRPRPLRVEPGDDPVEVRLRAAFEPLCQRPDERNDVAPHGRLAERWPEIAFSSNWEAYAAQMHVDADEGRRRLLARYEYPSVWETEEVFEHLTELIDDTEGLTGDNEAPQEPHPPMACPAAGPDPDAGKPRVTVKQYSALVGEDVAYHLEALARARVEKHKRMYQTDQ